MTHPQPDGTDRAAAASQFRHDLITPVNHILGFAELMIDEAEERGRGHLIARLDAVRDLGRGLREGIDHALHLAADGGPPADLAGLGRTLVDPCRAVVAAVDAIEAEIGPAEDRAFVLGDLAKIRDAAARLIAIAGDLGGGMA